MATQAVVVHSPTGLEVPPEVIGQHVTVISSRERRVSQFLIELQDGNCYWVDDSQLVPPSDATVSYADEPTSSSPESHD